MRICPLCVPFFRNNSFRVFIMSGEVVLNDVFSSRFEVGITVRHAERLVTDHLLGMFERTACHDDVGAVGVPVVVKLTPSLDHGQ